MPLSGTLAPSATRLPRLLEFLGHDPENLPLIADAAVAALDEGQPDQAEMLLERYAGLSSLPASMLNLKGLIAIQSGRFVDAEGVFQGLLADNPGDPTLCFNLAWCKAMLQDYDAVCALLDETAAAASPQAARLKIQALHHLGQLAEALTWGRGLAGRFADDAALAGALAAVAIDAEDVVLAEHYAKRAGNQHDGVATLGMLRLNDEQIDEALTLFDRALGAYPQDARALLGKGLGLLAKGDLTAAPAYIDQAAERFGHHLGSWVAAGWAYFINGDAATSRARFETALALDDTFAEIHGGLAVLDVTEGKLESAKRRTEIALRLDRNCFSAALAKSLMLTRQGDLQSAARIQKIALNVPLGASGRTIAQAMARMALAAGKPPR